MADGDEKSGRLDHALLAVAAAHPRSRHTVVVAEHLLRHRFEQRFDVGRAGYPRLHGLRRPQVVFADDQIDLAADRGQIGRLFAGRVSASHDDHVLIAVEKPVAGGAGRYAPPLEPLFGLQSEVFGCGAGRDDDRVGFDLPLAVDGHPQRPGREIDSRGRAEADVRTQMTGLRLHGFHQYRPVDSVGIAGKVLDLGGGGQLSARLHSLVEDRREPGSRCVDGRRIAGGTAADDQAFGFFGIHRLY